MRDGKRREEILRTALNLFNEWDTQKATTNHIAKACGISPGNLYYHFHNKEEIIRALYRQMTEKIGFHERALPSGICELKRYCAFVADIWWEYRFFRKEMLFLMQRDSRLLEMVTQDNRKQYRKLMELIDHFCAGGYLLLSDPKRKDLLVDSIMLYSQFWTTYLMGRGCQVDESVARVVSHRILALFEPFMTPKAEKEISHCQEMVTIT